MNIREMIKETISCYFNLNKEQRIYIEGLLDDKKAKWTKNQLIISLLLFNKSKVLSENEIELLKIYIEDNFKMIVSSIKKFELEYKQKIKSN